MSLVFDTQYASHVVCVYNARTAAWLVASMMRRLLDITARAEQAMRSSAEYDENDRDDDSSIVGTWIPIHSIGDGEQTSDEDLHGITPAFARGRCEVRRGDILIRKGTYCADIAKNPHELDVCFEQSDVPELIDATLKGIYHVDPSKTRTPPKVRHHCFRRSD